MKSLGLAMFLAAGLVSCSAVEPARRDASTVLDGPVAGLTSSESFLHANGDAAFNQTFTSLTGLGPIFVATSCASCHAGDGKGHPFTTLTRFGQTDSTGNYMLAQGGPQLQDHAIPGFSPEELPAGARATRLLPPSNTGLGFLELVSDADLLAMADPNDADHDGISGVPNYAQLPPYLLPSPTAVPRTGKYITRFGKKAGAYNLLHQTVNAYHQDIGITSEYEPTDTHSGLAGDPEISTHTLNDVVFYLQTLKAPPTRNQNDPTVLRGNGLFLTLGCERCHRQTLVTGASPVAALSHQEFHPYTDLLLHDLGPALDDGYTEGTAKTYEWRTPPLWGIGLAPASQGGQFYLLHDGRANSIESAIRLHGGEAGSSVNAFNALPATDQQALIEFLKSL